MKKLLIIGSLPQKGRIGGVTIHIQRLIDYLKSINMDYSIVDYKEDGVMKVIRSIYNADIIHIHVSNSLFRFFLVLIGVVFRKKTLITLHGNYIEKTKELNYWVLRSIKMATVPIAINEKSYTSCKKININTMFIPAFIPPQNEEVLQEEIKELIKTIHEKGKQIVSTNAYDLVYDLNGNEIYGIDFLINYFKSSDKYELLISDPSGNYAKKYPSKIQNISIINYPHPYYELLKLIDVFVRNTSTDGDSLSVKESLFIGKKTLCTDAVDRPEGVLLFHYSDKESFENSLFSIQKKEGKTIVNGASQLVELYKELMD